MSTLKDRYGGDRPPVNSGNCFRLANALEDAHKNGSYRLNMKTYGTNCSGCIAGFHHYMFERWENPDNIYCDYIGDMARFLGVTKDQGAEIALGNMDATLYDAIDMLRTLAVTGEVMWRHWTHCRQEVHASRRVYDLCVVDAVQTLAIAYAGEDVRS